MKIPPQYIINNEILELISKIEANLYFLSSLKLNPKLSKKIIRMNVLKSSLYSARIEGNPLDLDDLKTKGKIRTKDEVFNIVKAIEHIQKKVKKDFLIDKNFIFDLHSLIMTGKIGFTKNFRKEMGAIFNQSGKAIYLSPPPTKINDYIGKLINYINHGEPNPFINAFISHLVFEKIHPFLDGNGRVGRLLILAIILSKKGSDYFFVPFEKELEKERESYYYYFDVGLKNTNEYLIFMLKMFLKSVEELKITIENENKKTIFLPPRQEEIYLIIKDHRLVSFDQIRRRFLKVPERTLRYDLKKLAEKGLIIKVGKTKGSYYRAKD
jgi:Fic family protein